jgi:hypothetical protein
MWARAVEFMFGLWLLVSPFVFRHPPDATGRWATDLASALAIMTLASLSYWRKARRAHLGQMAVAAWLVGYGYLAGGHPSPPACQNEMLVGLTLLLFAIIPTEANEPPRLWREHLARRAEARGR